MPFFFNVVDDDGREAPRGPFSSREDALEAADESDLDVSRGVYRALNKSAAESGLHGGQNHRMSGDGPTPEMPVF